MEESWRIRKIPSEGSIPRRRSTERPSETRPVFSDAETLTLDVEDFADVFGGPPRSAFWRKASTKYASATGGNSFYEEVFSPSETPSYRCLSGRGLPVFRIPGSYERFYSDVFGSDDERLSRERSGTNSKAKSKASSVLSSEEMSPLRPAVGEHVTLSDFSSKLRPIHVPSRRNATDLLFNNHVERRQNTPSFYANRPSSAEQARFSETDQTAWNMYTGSGHFGFSRRASSPETISVERGSYPSVKISVEDADLNSPSSAVSSDFCLDDHIAAHGPKSETRDYDHVVDNDDDYSDEDDDDMSSYVIEFGSDHREETCDAVDDAIAWAKEKFQTHCEKETRLAQENSAKINEEVHDVIDNNKHEIIQSSPERELNLQDENIRLWSFGKETDIRLLLSTLHFILWSNSGWCAIPLTNIIESSQVKKAYQKARLCLHPDKLQQRGATISQKYVANKAFSILQDAWALFISQDVIFSG